jgi:hypothetical protein
VLGTPTRRLWRRVVRRPGDSGGASYADPATLAVEVDVTVYRKVTHGRLAVLPDTGHVLTAMSTFLSDVV